MPSASNTMLNHNTSSKRRKNSPKALDTKLRIFISGLPANTKKKELENFLKEFGSFSHLKLPMRKTNGFKECKGHAKVAVKDLETKEKFFSKGPLKKFRGVFTLKFESFLEGRNLVKKMAEIEVKKVSIYGRDEIKIESIRAVFSVFGKVEKVTWKKKEEKNNSKNLNFSSDFSEEKKDQEFYGNITFYSQESAERCLRAGIIHVEEEKIVKVRPYLTQFLNKIQDQEDQVQKSEKSGNEEKNPKIQKIENLENQQQNLEKDENSENRNPARNRNPVKSLHSQTPSLSSSIHSSSPTEIKLSHSRTITGPSSLKQQELHSESKIRLNYSSSSSPSTPFQDAQEQGQIRYRHQHQEYHRYYSSDPDFSQKKNIFSLANPCNKFTTSKTFNLDFVKEKKNFFLREEEELLQKRGDNEEEVFCSKSNKKEEILGKARFSSFSISNFYRGNESLRWLNETNSLSPTTLLRYQWGVCDFRDQFFGENEF